MQFHIVHYVKNIIESAIQKTFDHIETLQCTFYLMSGDLISFPQKHIYNLPYENMILVIEDRIGCEFIQDIICNKTCISLKNMKNIGTNHSEFTILIFGKYNIYSILQTESTDQIGNCDCYFTSTNTYSILIVDNNNILLSNNNNQQLKPILSYINNNIFSNSDFNWIYILEKIKKLYIIKYNINSCPHTIISNIYPRYVNKIHCTFTVSKKQQIKTLLNQENYIEDGIWISKIEYKNELTMSRYLRYDLPESL